MDGSLCGETVTWAAGARVTVAGTVVERLGTAVGVGKTDGVGVGVGTTVEITATVRVGGDGILRGIAAQYREAPTSIPQQQSGAGPTSFSGRP